ncbi:MAG TPA: archaeosortase/exosortase family protein [Bacteroidales bacterium]|nr:archaeosortase/exosortase family protein [Bacteroidales bacterium]
MFTSVKTFLDKTKLWPVVDVFLFIIITYLFHKLWWRFSYIIYDTSLFLSISDWLARMVYQASAWIDAHILGMDVTLYFKNIIHFNVNNRGIEINESCSGFKQMYQVVILFLLFPGPWRHKLWYIPMGMASMFVINIIRVVLLSVTMVYWPQHWDFIHLWVLRPFYYLVIFILWVIWVEKFGGMRRYFEKG